MKFRLKDMIISKPAIRNCILVLATVLAAVVASGCFGTSGDVPAGSWRYGLLLNGNPVGTAVISSRSEGDFYVTEMELTMKAGTVTNISRQIVTETRNFVPVKLETYNKIITGDKTQNIDTVATFKGNRVELESGGEKTVYEISRDFRLDGNYVRAMLMKGNFEKGLSVDTYIYEPSIDPEIPVLMKTRIRGRENIEVKGKHYSAIRVAQYIERFKSFDMYLDGNGILIKADITMLNMNIRLERE